MAGQAKDRWIVCCCVFNQPRQVPVVPVLDVDVCSNTFYTLTDLEVGKGDPGRLLSSTNRG